MADILKLSNKQSDLIKDSEETSVSVKNVDHLHKSLQTLAVKAKPEGGPTSREVTSTHELLSDSSRMKRTINQFIEEKRFAAGNGFAEKVIKLVYFFI